MRLTKEQLKADKLALERHWKQAAFMLQCERDRAELRENREADRNLIGFTA